MGRVGFLFAGQGAQTVGMGGDLYKRFSAVRELYATASERTGIDLVRSSFDGPLEELTRTDISQPAIVTASLAAWLAFRELYPDVVPSACAGLSLGEYSAWVAAGGLSALDAIEVVAARGRYMQQACDQQPGTMASVLGLESSRIEEVLVAVSTPQLPVVVSNLNAPGQTVISGSVEAVAVALDKLKEAGARRAIELSVAGAYHSPLMASAAQALRPHLEALAWRSPRCAVVANVTGRPYGPEDLPSELLAQQVCSTVRWVQSVGAMVEACGIKSFYAFGPGGVLRGLIRKCARGVSVVEIMTCEELDGAAEGLS